MKLRSFLLLMLVGLIFLPQAHAARRARISADTAEVYDSPGADHKVLGKVKRGSVVATSNNSRDGYYKVRTKTGILGWIEEGALSFKDAPPPPPRSASVAVPRSSYTRFNDKARARLMGGLDFFSASDVNTLYGFDALKTGLYFGGEFAWMVSPKVAIGLRVETLSKSVSASDASTGTDFDIQIKSMPVMVGPEFDLHRSRDWQIGFAAYVGLGLSTSLTSTASNLSGSNVTVLDGGGLTALGKFNFTKVFSKNFGAFLELGYRYLPGSAKTPSTAGNGSYIFREGGSAAGTLLNASLNLNGPVAGFGFVGFF